MSGLCVVSAIVLLCGTMAGLRNWLLSDLPLSARSFCGRTVEATIAASTVPLFLSFLGNEKLNAVFGPFLIDRPTYVLSLCVFFGFAMIAAVFSKHFLDTVSLMQLQKRVEQVKIDVDHATKLAEVNVEDSIAERPLKTDPAQLGKIELDVLRKLVEGHFSIRSVIGLSASAGIHQDKVVETLEKLETGGFVERVRTSKGERWAATNVGRLAILG